MQTPQTTYQAGLNKPKTLSHMKRIAECHKLEQQKQ